MKLRLYAVRDTVSGQLLPDSYSSSKPEAKRLRDQLNEGDCPPLRYVVTYGPDHRRYRH